MTYDVASLLLVIFAMNFSARYTYVREDKIVGHTHIRHALKLKQAMVFQSREVTSPCWRDAPAYLVSG